MADDTSYSTFLSKANDDPQSGSRADTYPASTSQARSRYDPSQTSGPQSGIPVALQSLPDKPYVSDTDSDWEPVFFSYAADELPSLEQFKQVLRASEGFGEQGAEGHSVSEMSVREFDPRGEYEEVIDRVKQVARETGQGKRGNLSGEENENGGVKIFRVEVGRTRVRYYVLTVGERKLVGVVAKAVES